jgi:ABC-type phosphate transport system permease subunit
MTLWWIGNLVLAVVVIPVVLVLLNNLMKPVNQIGKEADAILAGGVTAAAQLDLLAGLVPTQESVKRIRAGVLAYGAALDKIL